MASIRQTYHEVVAQHQVLQQRTDLLSVFDQFPDMALVLNQQRQVVYGNQALMQQLGLNNMQEALSHRPGELMHCVHARKSGDCGEAAGCRYCDAVNAVRESQATNSAVTKEARVTVQPGDRTLPLDIKVTAKPLALENLPLTMVFFSDISDHKRREYLEEIFLHDTRNTIHALGLMTELMETKVLPEEFRKDLGTIQRYVDMLSDDLAGHQMLIEAERGTLQVELAVVPTHELMSESLQAVAKFAQAAKVGIALELERAPELVRTAPRLARRVLVNVLKNAIEATPKAETISVQVGGNDNCLFEIANPGQMSLEVQEQVFQRSFSTKEAGRGLGTYSMRLLLENYLDGGISFSSSHQHGTCFRITLPVV